MARSLAAIVVAAALGALVPAAARADGDPASDYLYGQEIFYPFRAPIPAERKAALAAVAAQSQKFGFRVKIAMIGDRYDLGSVPSLFGKPQEYAQFLGQELRFLYKGTLLIVMPNGYGVAKNGKPVPAEQRALAGLASPTAQQTDLASAAIDAVQRLAATHGIRLVAPKPNTSTSSRTSDRIKIVVAALVALSVVAGVVLARRRVRR